MKQFRFLFLGLVLALSVVAIGHATSQRHVILQTWYLISGGNPDNKNDYRTTSQGFDCNGDLTICSIQADDDGTGKPDLVYGAVSTNQSLYSATHRN